MAKFKFHKLVALVVLAASAAWILTGEFSSVGSAIGEGEEESAQPVAEAVSSAPRTVAAIVPPRIEHARSIRVSGTTEANKRATLAARSAGIIAKLPVEQGDLVREGDLVLALDEEEKPAAVETAKALLAQREAEAAAAERLIRSGNMPKLQAESTQAALAAARSQLETAKAELARVQVVAPFDGLVDRVVVEPGSSIMQGAEVATILGMDPILAVGEVSEHNIHYLQRGDEADIRLVNGERFKGAVQYISRDASPQTRTFRIEVAIPNPDRRIPAGMTAEITVRAERVPAVFLPRSVVTLSDAGDLGIRVVREDQTVGFIPIDLIDDTPNGLVLGGVPEDARIIVAGQDLVSEGDKVNPVEADQETVKRLVGEAGGAVN